MAFRRVICSLMDANVGRGVARCGCDREGLDLLLGRAQRLRKLASTTHGSPCVAYMKVPPPLLPAHIEETIRSIVGSTPSTTRSHAASARRMTALLGRPRFIGVLTVIAAGWSLNLLAAALGYRPGAA
jgi:hypothetical protein